MADNNTLVQASQMLGATKQLMSDLTHIANTATSLVNALRYLGTVAIQHLGLGDQAGADVAFNGDLAEAGQSAYQKAEALNAVLRPWVDPNGSATRALQTLCAQSESDITIQ